LQSFFVVKINASAVHLYLQYLFPCVDYDFRGSKKTKASNEMQQLKESPNMGLVEKLLSWELSPL
jgi:hypothetical protein